MPNLKQLRDWPGRFGAAALRLHYYLFSGSRAGLPPIGFLLRAAYQSLISNSCRAVKRIEDERPKPILDTEGVVLRWCCLRIERLHGTRVTLDEIEAFLTATATKGWEK